MRSSQPARLTDTVCPPSNALRLSHPPCVQLWLSLTSRIGSSDSSNMTTTSSSSRTTGTVALTASGAGGTKASPQTHKQQQQQLAAPTAAAAGGDLVTCPAPHAPPAEGVAAEWGRPRRLCVSWSGGR